MMPPLTGHIFASLPKRMSQETATAAVERIGEHVRERVSLTDSARPA
jgi:hypothetical protein